MKIPILADLLDKVEKLVVEHGSAGAQSKHIAQLRDYIEQLEKENQRLEKAVVKLSADLAEASKQLARHTSTDGYVEWKGVLIRRLPGGGYSDTPYCPTCKLPLSVVPRTKHLFCNREECGYLPHMSIVVFREHLRTLETAQHEP
jgi:hypothetical protein